jgi:hypothetical protein
MVSLKGSHREPTLRSITLTPRQWDKVIKLIEPNKPTGSCESCLADVQQKKEPPEHPEGSICENANC